MRSQANALEEPVPGGPPPGGGASLLYLPAAENEAEVTATSRWSRLWKRPTFLALVLIPNLLGLIYFGLLASPVYSSTASFIVLNPKQNGPSLSSLLAGASGDSSELGGYILKDYFHSWEAFQKVRKPLRLEENFSQGDLVARFGGLKTLFRRDDVALWHYFQDTVAVDIDQKSGIVSLEVDGYSPEFAAKLARALLSDAVAHMDAMSDQQMRDYLASAASRRRGAEEALRRDLAQLARYRDSSGTYDPKELYTSQLQLMNSLALKEAELRAQRSAIAQATPNNPTVGNLDTAIAAVRREIAGVERTLPALSRTSARHEDLVVSRDNNITQLNQANMALQEARLSAERNRYYLNVISSPSEPRTSEKPDRPLWIGGIALLSLVAWGLLG